MSLEKLVNSGKSLLLGIFGAHAISCGDVNEVDIYHFDNYAMSSKKTNQDGVALLMEGIEQVPITVLKNDEPIAGANVLYIDGEMELFQVTPPSGPPTIGLYPHNSGHTIRLTSHPFQSAEHTGTYFDHAVDWGSANGTHQGCWTKDEASQVMKAGTWIIKTLSNNLTLGINNVAVDQAANYLRGQWGNNEVADIFLFNPSDHGFYGTSTVWTMVNRKGDCGTNYVPPNQIPPDIEQPDPTKCDQKGVNDLFEKFDSCLWETLSGSPYVQNGKLVMNKGDRIRSKIFMDDNAVSLNYAMQNTGSYNFSLGQLVIVYGGDQFPDMFGIMCPNKLKLFDSGTNHLVKATSNSESTFFQVSPGGQETFYDCKLKGFAEIYAGAKLEMDEIKIN